MIFTAKHLCGEIRAMHNTFSKLYIFKIYLICVEMYRNILLSLRFITELYLICTLESCPWHFNCFVECPPSQLEGAVIQIGSENSNVSQYKYQGTTLPSLTFEDCLQDLPLWTFINKNIMQ